MADGGSRHGTDGFEVAARSAEGEVDLDGRPLTTLSDITDLPQPRRWPRSLARTASFALAVLVAGASAFVIGRSLAPPGHARVAQRLEGRTERIRIATVDAVGRRGGGSGASTTVVATAPQQPSSTQVRNHKRREPRHHKDRGGGVASSEPDLPEPTLPLYHLERTFKRKKPDHYFTASEMVKEDKLDNGYEFIATEGFVFGRYYEGTIAIPADNGTPGYIYEEKERGALPLYMLRGYNGYGDIFTSDVAYKEKMIEDGWNDFGIVGYIAQT
jgi:hypothetical protein